MGSVPRGSVPWGLSLLLAALAALTIVALQRGAADLAAFGARHALDRAGFATAEARTRAQRRLEQAIRLDGGNADHREYLARWHESGGHYGEALAHYRAAVAARPASPYAWADIARMKVRLGELDAELDEAVKNAARLGPWEPRVQLSLAAIVFQAAEKLAPDARRLAFGAMSNALKRQERQLVELAFRGGRLDLLCAIPGIGAYPAARRCI